MGRWLEDSLNVLDNVTAKKQDKNNNGSGSSNSNKQILVGSSMGTWLAILTAMQRPERIAGIVGIASAPDYTVLLRQQIESNALWAKKLREKGSVDVPTVYDRRGYYRIHRELIEEGDHHLLLDESKDIALPNDIPIRLIHGMADNDISFEYSQKLVERLRSTGNGNVGLDLQLGGDHRLSSPEHLQKIQEVLDEVVEDVR